VGVEQPLFLHEDELPAIPSGWQWSRSDSLVIQLKPGKLFDTKTVAPAGAVPVLNQSESGVLGYHDEEPGVVASPSAPVVTFANHTCAMRLVRHPFSAIQNIFPKVGRPGVCDTVWFYYALLGRVRTNEYKGHHPLFRDAFVPVPPIATQRRIASILSAYDDLIENNTRRIAILEEMARRIYNEWFVRFRFPGHEGLRMVESELGLVPEGWAAVRFEELLDSSRGGDWGSDEISGGDTAPVSVIRGTDFDDLAHGTGNRVPARFIEPKSLEKRRLRPFDVVVENSINAKSRSAGKTLLITPGLLKRLGGDAIAASFCKVFRFRDPKLAALAHQKMRQLFESGDMAFYQNVAANGIANFQATRFVATQFVLLPIDELPRKQILEVFSTLTRSTYADAISNLRITRDFLLPKLISGELDVSATPEPEALAA
jgi:type I restriction enzyme S subunit